MIVLLCRRQSSVDFHTQIEYIHPMAKRKKPEFSTGISLRTHLLERPAPVRLDPARIRAIRADLGMSREFFARCLRVPGRTLEKWEQGASHPTGAGVALLLLIEKKPELAAELAVL